MLRILQQTTKRWQSRLSAWMILVFFSLGWGPVFIAGFVVQVSPSRAANYGPQAFAMSWIPIVVLCSFLAIVSFVVMITLRLLGR